MKITKLEKFLINRNLMEVFKYNLIHGGRISKSIPDLIENRHPSILIQCAFSWHKSKEGCDFWENIDREWFNCLMTNTL